MTTKRYQTKSFNNDSWTSNSIFNIYHASFYTNKNLSNNKLMFRIKCSIISISIIKYHFFRRLLYIDIKNKELRLNIVRCKRNCSQEEICNQEEICVIEICVIEICSQERIYSQDLFILKNARKLIKNDRIVNTKKRELRSSSAFSFFFAKIKTFQILRINTSEREDNCHDLTSLHTNFTH
jgi:hypothetical protein